MTAFSPKTFNFIFSLKHMSPRILNGPFLASLSPFQPQYEPIAFTTAHTNFELCATIFYGINDQSIKEYTIRTQENISENIRRSTCIVDLNQMCIQYESISHWVIFFISPQKMFMEGHHKIRQSEKNARAIFKNSLVSCFYFLYFKTL